MDVEVCVLPIIIKVFVFNNNVDRALRVATTKCQIDGCARICKRKSCFISASKMKQLKRDDCLKKNSKSKKSRQGEKIKPRRSCKF